MSELLTLQNARPGLYVHEASILGNLRVQKIVEIGKILDATCVRTQYLAPARPVYPTSYYLEGRFVHRRLAIIEDPVAFIRGNWLTEQARYIMQHDVDGLGLRMYQACAWACAHRIIERWKRSEEWKETIRRRRWQFQDYTSPDGLTIREGRTFSQSDRMYNGSVQWAVMQPDGQRGEWTTLIDCVRALGLWFDDQAYIAALPAAQNETENI